MKMLFLLVLILFYQRGFSQQQHQPAAYLQVRMVKEYDANYFRRTSYYTIAAEPGCDKAEDIYKLSVYKDLRHLDTTIKFYGKQSTANRNDTAVNYYNYFASPTEALNFIAAKNWILIAVYNDVTSDYKYPGVGNNSPVTTVSSNAVYCFKKEE